MFQITFGSVIGRDHSSLLTSNNQDAFTYELGDNIAVLVVADGCSGSIHSELGARLGAQWTKTAILKQAKRRSPDDPRFWSEVRREVLHSMSYLASSFGGSYQVAVAEHFLFTIVAAVVTNDQTVIAAIGDGVFAVNGEVTVLNPLFPNQPEYLAYELVSPDFEYPPGAFDFKIHAVFPTQLVKHLLVGSDGLSDFIANEDRYLPGTTTPLGSLSQFWENDHFFSDPDDVSLLLRQANIPSFRVDWQAGKFNRKFGLLGDDTTLIVGRFVNPNDESREKDTEA